MSVEKIGKPCKHNLEFKKYMADENEQLYKQNLSLYKLYSEQPQRTKCKLCNSQSEEHSVIFTIFDVPWLQCSNCGQVYGLPEDTDEYIHKLYIDNSGESYGATYCDQDLKKFRERVNSIYRPKVDFMIEVLKKDGLKLPKIKIADLGSGCGHFVSACLDSGLVQVQGYEISQFSVNKGNKILGQPILNQFEVTNLNSLIRNLSANVVTMIGVLEHVQGPRSVLENLQANEQVEYLYISVPMYSPSIFIELAFHQNFVRQLGPAHTHVFTESSLKYLAQEFNMTIVGEWWFGSDLIDLYRNVMVELQKQNDNHQAQQKFRTLFLPLLDRMQTVIDREHLSSEVHMLFKFNR